MQSINDELEVKIIKQLEYYFSDFNLIKDKFMKDMINRDNGCQT